MSNEPERSPESIAEEKNHLARERHRLYQQMESTAATLRQLTLAYRQTEGGIAAYEKHWGDVQRHLGRVESKLAALDAATPPKQDE